MPSAGTTDHLREQRQRQMIEPIAMRVPEAAPNSFVAITALM